MSFKSIVTKLSTIRNREEGVTAIEYALIAALVAVAIIGGATALGNSIDGQFTTLSGTVSNPGGN